MIEIIPYGDHAVLINLQQIIDPKIHKAITTLSNSIRLANISGVNFIIPAYCSITVAYDPELIDFESIKESILTIYNPKEIQKKKSRIVRVPVCYENKFSLDMEELEKSLKMDRQELAKLHCDNEYEVYMLGFLPGFPYMGVNPKQMTVNRKDNPRLRIPARSVGLAGEQTGIYPIDCPGGWQIIGRTPLEIILDDSSFLLRPGDKVKFYRISLNEYNGIRKEVKGNKIDIESFYE